MSSEDVERPEGIRQIGDVAGAVLGYSRIFIEPHHPPIEVAVMLVPMKLSYPGRKWRRPVKDAEVAAPVKTEPDLVIPLIMRTIPDEVNCPCFLRRQTVACRRGWAATNIGRGIEATGPWIVDNTIRDPVRGVARRHR